VFVIGHAGLVIDDVQYAVRRTCDEVDRALERHATDRRLERLLDGDDFERAEFFDRPTCALARVRRFGLRDVREFERRRCERVVDRRGPAVHAHGAPEFERAMRERSDPAGVGDASLFPVDADEARLTFAEAW
jgi:hypothetical protein